jgi:putative addiction module component (TIGR02574 family)
MDGITLTQEALRLNIVEKVHLIDALWHSLDSSDQTDIDQAWLQECHDRLAAYKDGHLVATDGQEILSEIRAALR